MIKIYTKYEGPTDTRGARIIAQHKGKSARMPYDHVLSPVGNRTKIARTLADRLGIDDFEMVWR